MAQPLTAAVTEFVFRWRSLKKANGVLDPFGYGVSVGPFKDISLGHGAIRASQPNPQAMHAAPNVAVTDDLPNDFSCARVDSRWANSRARCERCDAHAKRADLRLRKVGDFAFEMVCRSGAMPVRV